MHLGGWIEGGDNNAVNTGWYCEGCGIEREEWIESG